MRNEDSKRKAAKFVRTVRAALRPLKNAERAAAMRSYMRGKFEYLGVGTPQRRKALARWTAR